MSFTDNRTSCINTSDLRQQTFDPNEWDRHWEDLAEGMEGNPALLFRRRLVFFLLELIRDGSGARVIDIGCGEGTMAAALSRTYPAIEIAGVDASRTGVAMARRKAINGRFEILDLLGENPVPAGLAGWATHALCSEVIEHVDDPVSLLRNVRRLLEPNARLVLTAPGGPMSAFDCHVGHRRHYTADTLTKTLEQAGFVVDLVRRAGFPFHTLYRLVVIARGRKAVDDASGRSGVLSRLMTQSAFVFFRLAFRLNLRDAALGWQLLAVARPASNGQSGCL